MVEVKPFADLRRTFLIPPDAETSGTQIAIVEVDLREGPAWTLKAAYHSIFVHLEGQLTSHEAKFESGLSTNVVPSTGCIWIVPADQRFDIWPRGSFARFCEIRIPTRSSHFDAIEFAPRINAKDALLYEAARVFQRQVCTDNAVRMSSRSLMQVVHWHIIDRYSVNPQPVLASSKTLSASMKEQVISYINDPTNSRVTLDELAKLTSLNINVLLKQFYASFGMTPAQYIVGVRIERAKSLLASSSLPVNEIALVAGFPSPAHLNAVFMKHVGIAPLAFRQAQRALGRAKTTQNVYSIAAHR